MSNRLCNNFLIIKELIDRATGHTNTVFGMLQLYANFGDKRYICRKINYSRGAS